jgi:hypothetical protein
MPQTESSRPMFRLAACVVALGCLLTPPADAQSDASLRQSEASLMASVEVPVAIVAALAQGGKFVVSGVAASGAVVAVTVSVVGLGASFVVYLSVEAVKSLALASGQALEAVAVSGGWLLMTAGEALCFIADDTARTHVHSRRLSP